MAYYDALATRLSQLSGSMSEKIATINAENVPGPRIDVAVSSVLGDLMLSGAYLRLYAFASNTPTGDPSHDQALADAKMLLALVTSANAPAFNTADPGRYAMLAGMLDALVAMETETGISQTVRDGLLARAETKKPWWQANGYSSPIGFGDIEAAGIE